MAVSSTLRKGIRVGWACVDMPIRDRRNCTFNHRGNYLGKKASPAFENHLTLLSIKSINLPQHEKYRCYTSSWSLQGLRDSRKFQPTAIAFGACAHENKPQPIWDAIVNTKPDLFIFAGDNIYADTEDMEVMKAKYAKLAAKPGYKSLLETCPVLATWDDHDFGVNDGGKHYSMKRNLLSFS